MQVRFRLAVLSIMAVVALALGGLGSRAVSAQDDAIAAAGFPEIALTLTDAGLEGVPAETAAGWYSVSLANNITPSGDPFTDAWGVDFIQLPADMTIEQVDAAVAMMMGPPPGEEGSASASPEAMEGAAGASPEAMDGMDMASPAAEDPLAFLYEAYLPGGPGALQGETGTAAIFLAPGDYAVAVLGLTGSTQMTVTGEADMASGSVAADATITETGTSGSFDFSATMTSGPGVIEIYNESDQPHFILGVRSDVPFTEEEVVELISAEEPPPTEGATPAAGADAGPPIAPAFYTGTQSTDTTQYISVDLGPGYYILLCFVGDPQMGGVPHSFSGMIEVVPVGVDGATPAA